jgi:DNA-binding IclR family transcriptional regulator
MIAAIDMTGAARSAAGEGPSLRQVPAVTRAVAILRLLGQSDIPLGVNAIARTLGIIPSTCLHILRALVAEELVAVDHATKHYTLDAGILTLARAVLRRNSFAQVVQPHLDRLLEAHGVTAIGVEVIGLEHMVVVAISQAELGLRLHVDIGSRFPALISATGRCVAAFAGQPWPEVERRFRGLRWNRAPSLKAWREEVARTVRDGYSVDEGNYIAGVTIVAVPVKNGVGRMTHGIVCVGLGEQVRRAGIVPLAKRLREAAEAVSHRLGATAE